MPDLSDLITVAVTTSPTASDPSTETIDATQRSVREYAELAGAPLLIGADGVRPEQREMTHAYFGKLDRLRIYQPVKAFSVWAHQANVLRMLLEHVETPLVLVMEHDAPLLPVPIDWNACARTILDGTLDLVRFHHESHVLPEHTHLMIDSEPQVSEHGLMYLRTAQWSQRPHLARTDWYRNIVNVFAPSSRCFVEDAVYGMVNYAWRERGVVGWQGYKLALYADPEPTMQRSFHLDGRGGEPKLGQVFAYIGETPPGAPAPTLGRVWET